eukprot:3791147-Pleurochrysis_carterae.AAC.2
MAACTAAVSSTTALPHESCSCSFKRTSCPTTNVGAGAPPTCAAHAAARPPSPCVSQTQRAASALPGTTANACGSPRRGVASLSVVET